MRFRAGPYVYSSINRWHKCPLGEIKEKSNLISPVRRALLDFPYNTFPFPTKPADTDLISEIYYGLKNNSLNGVV